MKRRSVLFGAVALGTAAAGFLAYRGRDGDLLQEAVFEDLSGRARRLSEWPAKVLALNFWATWCGPCREEMPVLLRASERYRSRGLEVIGIALDLPANVAPYVKSMGITYPILLAERSGVDLIRKLGNPAAALPFTVFLAAGGQILERKLGPFTTAELEDSVVRLLA